MEMTKVTGRNTPVGYQTILSNGQHAYLADEPVDHEGTGLGFKPFELLLSSLAACKTMTIRYLARQKGWNLTEAYAEMEMQTERREGKTYSVFTTKLRLEGDLTEDQRAQLLRVADRCPVHRLLTGEITIEEAIWLED